MQHEVTEAGPFESLLTIRIDESELEDAKTQAARKLSHDVKLKGFRPGKAPRRVVEAAVGPQAIRSEAIDAALPGFVTEAVVAAELQPVVTPAVERIDDIDGGVEAEVRLTMWPRLESPPDASGRMIEIDPVDVSQEEIQEHVDRVRDQFAELEDVGRAAAEKDFVSIDLSATRDGVAIDEAAATDLLYEIGSKSFFDGLDDALVGLEIGGIQEFDTTLPAGFGDHGGESVTMRVLVKAVKAKVLPEVTDEWVSDVSEFETVEDMMESLRVDIGRSKLEGAANQYRNRLVAELVDEMDLDLPQALIDAETEAAVHDFSHRLEQQGLDISTYLQISGLTPDALLEDFRGGAERGLKGRILLEAVIDAEGIEAEEAEYADLVARAATESGRPADELAEQLAASGQDKALAGDILRRKALDLLAERATPVDGEGNPVDLVIPDDEEDAGNEDDTGPEPGEVDE